MGAPTDAPHCSVSVWSGLLRLTSIQKQTNPSPDDMKRLVWFTHYNAAA